MAAPTAQACIVVKCESELLCVDPLGSKFWSADARFEALSLAGSFEEGVTQFPVVSSAAGRLLPAAWLAAAADGSALDSDAAFEPTPLVAAGILARNWTAPSKPAAVLAV